MKRIIFFLILIGINCTALAINVGFNQAWFKTAYSGQYLDKHFDAGEVERIFNLAKEAHAQTVRLWFFESSSFPMINWENDRMISLKDDYIKNVITTLQLAQKYNIKIYMTVFDAHSYRPDKLSKEELQKFQKMFQPEGIEFFLKTIMAPLLKAIDQEKLSHTISKIDLVNEGDTLVFRGAFENKWNGVNQMLCLWKKSLQAYEGFISTPLTMSIRLHPLLPLPGDLLADGGPLKCADIIDFHSYDDDGDIHRCSFLKKYASLKKKKLILGEFGQSYFNHRFSDELQSKNTINYIKNASRCGFDEALAWRLSDIRPGPNKEARYSFEANGGLRPAYFIIQENNQ